MVTIDIRMQLMMAVPFIIFLVVCIIYFSLRRREIELINAINKNSTDNTSDFDEVQTLINGLKNNLNEEKMEKAIEVLNTKQYLAYSEDSILNSLLNSKIEVCNLKNIAINCGLIEAPDGMRISETVALIGNLFDNAIEACELCIQNNLDVRIDVECGVRAGLWIFKIRNSKLEEAKPVKDKFISTKMDKQNHGLGMRIIKEIVDKHKGILKIKDKGNKIEITISI